MSPRPSHHASVACTFRRLPPATLMSTSQPAPRHDAAAGGPPCTGAPHPGAPHRGALHRGRARLLPAVILLSLGSLAGCNDERVGVAPLRPVPLPVPSNAWIVVSDSAARAGSEVTVAAFASSEAGGAVGSFTARFLYDSLQLQVLGTDSISDQVLRAMNPIPGEHRIAGASAQGLPGGLLFRLRAKVIDPRGLRRLGLVIDEMHSIKFADLTMQLEVQDTRAALLSGVPGLRVQPAPERRP